MTLIVVAAAVAAGLVAVAGVAKLLRPEATRRQLVLPGGRRVPVVLVRLLGAGEVVLAVAVLLRGGPGLLAALGLVYLGFLGVASHQRSAGRGCGCLGATPGTVGITHLALNALAALVLITAAVLAPVAPVAVLPGELAGVTTLVLLGVATALAALVLTRLPELSALQAGLTDGTDGSVS